MLATAATPRQPTWAGVERGTGLHPTHPARLHSFEDCEILAELCFPSAIKASILPQRIFPQKLI